MRQQEPHGVQCREIRSLVPGGIKNPGSRPTGWKASWQKGPWGSWWTQIWAWPSSAPSWPQKLRASRAASGRCWQQGGQRWSCPSTLGHWDTSEWQIQCWTPGMRRHGFTRGYPARGQGIVGLETEITRRGWELGLFRLGRESLGGSCQGIWTAEGGNKDNRARPFSGGA